MSEWGIPVTMADRTKVQKCAFVFIKHLRVLLEIVHCLLFLSNQQSTAIVVIKIAVVKLQLGATDR